MMSQVNITSLTSRGVIASLRAPCAKNSLLKRGYSQNPRHLGQVHAFPATSEPVIAPGTGTVKIIRNLNNTDWGHEVGELDTFKTFQITIDHGGHVSTVIQGLTSVDVVVGQYVTRGDRLGLPRTTEIFFQLFYLNSPLDPATFSSFFRGFDSGKVTDKGHQLRAGPDFLDREESGTVSYLIGGVRYFVDEQCDKPSLLVNIDFNGSLKTGLAAVGLYSNDYWNSYNPVFFGSLPGDTCMTIINPRMVMDVDGDDSGAETITFESGVLFETLVHSSPFDNGTSAISFLFGSTDNIPSIDTITSTTTFSSGAIAGTVFIGTGTDNAATSVVFYRGTLADVVIYGLGTDYPFIMPYTEAGTNNITFQIGTLFDIVVSTTHVESGTNDISFLSGGTTTFVIVSEGTEASSTTIEFFNGSIHQF